MRMPQKNQIYNLIEFKKIVVVKDYMQPWKDENGIQYVGIEDFLLDETLISR